jgi:hypothetical protein
MTMLSAQSLRAPAEAHQTELTAASDCRLSVGTLRRLTRWCRVYAAARALGFGEGEAVQWAVRLVADRRPA